MKGEGISGVCKQPLCWWKPACNDAFPHADISAFSHVGDWNQRSCWPRTQTNNSGPCLHPPTTTFPSPGEEVTEVTRPKRLKLT